MASALLVKAGACFFSTSSSFDRCALQPIECSSDQDFRSAGWLAANDLSVTGTCSDQETVRNLNSLGRCDGVADRFICTSDKTACRFQSVFAPLTTDCNLVQDFLSSNEFTHAHFGFCKSVKEDDKDNDDDNYFCAWKFKDCGDRSLYQWQIADPFFSNQNPRCHCDDVRTGACVHKTNGNTFCAVTAEVCETDEGYTFLPVLELHSQLNTTCHLCDVLPAGALVVVTPSPVSTPGSVSNTSPVNAPNSDSGGDSSGKGSDVEDPHSETIIIEMSGSSGEYRDGGVVTGIVIGAIFGAAAVTVGIVFVIRRSQSSIEKQEDFEDAPSVQAPSVS